MNTKPFALALALLVLAGTVYATTGQDSAARNGRGGWRAKAARSERPRAVREFVRGLEFTDAQRNLARDHARTIEPRARELWQEARRIREQARESARTGDREAIRADARARLRALRDGARAEFAPHGRALIEALTPEQRARIEARLREHGRTFDAQRASERVGRWLARPHVRERLEARTRR